MALRKNHHNSARLVRDILGDTQSQFAARVGLSKSMIQQIEAGFLAVSEDVAWKYSTATGVLPQSVWAGEGIPKGLDGQPFSRAHFDHWNSADQSHSTDLCIAFNSVRLLLLLRAAARQQRLRAVDLNVQNQFESLQSAFGLETSVRSVSLIASGQFVATIEDFDDAVANSDRLGPLRTMIDQAIAALSNAKSRLEELERRGEGTLDDTGDDGAPRPNTADRDADGFDQSDSFRNATYMRVVRRSVGYDAPPKARKSKRAARILPRPTPANIDEPRVTEIGNPQQRTYT